MAKGGSIAGLRRIPLLLVLVCGFVVAWVPAAYGAFPGANGKIAFAKDHQSGLDLVAVNPDGTGLVNITNSPGSSSYDQERYPAWSPEGTRLAYRAGPSPGHIWVINADGSSRRQITFDAPRFGDGDLDPAWSPDGQRIVFSRDLNPGDSYNPPCPRYLCQEIFTVKPDGSELTRITYDGFNEYQPEWSPDGEQIAFTRTFACRPPTDPNPGCPGGIYVMNPDGTGQTALTSGGLDPSWSPDSRKIAFQRSLGQIATMNRDGSDFTRLTFEGPAPFIIPDQPVWSPDGQRIAFRYGRNSSLSSAGSEIFTIKPDGTGLTQVTNDAYFDYDPNWQPIPNRPPDCTTARSDPSVLWPPNRKFTLVFVSGVTDPDGDSVTVTIDGVSQDEPARSKGSTVPDAASGTAPHSVKLRAERNPHGDGRVYKIAFTASDSRGSTCSGTVTVGVPNHKRLPAVDSAPPSFDSFGN